MSLRLKSLLIAVQISALMWALIIATGLSVYSSFQPNLDPVMTASTK